MSSKSGGGPAGATSLSPTSGVAASPSMAGQKVGPLQQQQQMQLQLQAQSAAATPMQQPMQPGGAAALPGGKRPPGYGPAAGVGDMFTVANAAGDEAVGAPQYEGYAAASKRLIENPHGNVGVTGMIGSPAAPAAPPQIRGVGGGVTMAAPRYFANDDGMPKHLQTHTEAFDLKVPDARREFIPTPVALREPTVTASGMPVRMQKELDAMQVGGAGVGGEHWFGKGC